MKKRYYYKMTLDDLGSLLFSKQDEKLICVQYKKNKWVYPKLRGSKLFVFNTLKNIKRCGLTGRVWKCEVKNPKLLTRLKNRIVGTYEPSIIDFWNGKRKGDNTAHRGTVLCNAVKLIEEVRA